MGPVDIFAHVYVNGNIDDEYFAKGQPKGQPCVQRDGSGQGAHGHGWKPAGAGGAGVGGRRAVRGEEVPPDGVQGAAAACWEQGARRSANDERTVVCGCCMPASVSQSIVLDRVREENNQVFESW